MMLPQDRLDRTFRRCFGGGHPSDGDVEALLELAGVAAHASERIAAPISCWLVATSGRSLAEARLIADAWPKSCEDSSKREHAEMNPLRTADQLSLSVTGGRVPTASVTVYERTGRLVGRTDYLA